MTQEDKELLLRDLCARLPYGVKGKVKADAVVPHEYDIDGFALETTFDVDVELQRIDASNDEVFVSTFDNNEDLGNYIEECQSDIPYTIEEFTPYLRPLSSMTEGEFNKLKEYSGLIYDQLDLASFQDGAYKCLDFYLNEIPADIVIIVFDWLNKNHFDYRGLIPKGVALPAPKEIYLIEE